MNKPIIIEECLAPTDNEIKKEDRERNIKTMTNQQDVHAYNTNHPKPDTIKVKIVWELQDVL